MLRSLWEGAKSYFTDQDPTFWVALTPALIVSALVFVRSPMSNYIFDEQEALLANPYVNAQGGLRFWDAVRRDFWGLPADRSIGSYRPLPNLVWRLLWHVSNQPFLHHWVNVIGHALNAALLASFAFAVTRNRRVGWLAGACFATSAVITEAVTGVVGIADVLGGLGVLLALTALTLPLVWMPFGVFFGLTVGLFSKESAIVGVPLIAWAALTLSPMLHARPLRFPRALLAGAAAVLALVAYTAVRKHFFPLPSPTVITVPDGAGWARRSLAWFLNWFQQPALPSDPINNPLVRADTPHRVAGGLRVFARGFGQVLFPWTLSGDYSFSQEPIPDRLFFPGSIIGGALLVFLPAIGICLWFVALVRDWFPKERSADLGRAAVLDARFERVGLLPVLALAGVWISVAYFPHSNLPVLLPTVRAERFWYLPLVGTSLLLAVAFDLLLKWRFGSRIVLAFIAVQVVRARAHAFDYSDDLSFWDATRKAAPNSAKAHLNYSVMVGARGKLEQRLEANRRALELAPNWPMANVYYGDTLCRMKKPDAAWPHYKAGFELAPNDSNLIALGLQCMWDQNAVESRNSELLELASRHPGSWLALLATELVYYGKEHNGIQQKYRPRSYNEGPKND